MTQPTQTISPTAGWQAVTAMFAFNGGLYGVWASRIPALKDQLAISHGTLGVLLLALAGGAIVAFPLAGRTVDRRGAAAVTRVLMGLNGLCLALLPFAASFGGVWGAGVLLMLFGATHGAMDVAMNTWATEVEKHFNRIWMPGFHAMFSLGAGIGALSGFLAASQSVGLGAHFPLMVLALGLPAIALARVPWHSPKSAPSGKGFALPSGVLILVGLCAMCASLGEGSVADWSAVFLRDETTATEAQAALGFAAFSVTMVTLRLLGGKVIAALGPVLSLRLSGLSAAFGVSLVIWSSGYTMALIGFAIMGLGYALVFPLAFSRAAADGRVPPGQAIASVATLGYGGLLLGPPILGGLAQLFGLTNAFLFLLGLALFQITLAPALKTK